jgi:hypothetical protein
MGEDVMAKLQSVAGCGCVAVVLLAGMAAPSAAQRNNQVHNGERVRVTAIDGRRLVGVVENGAGDSLTIRLADGSREPVATGSLHRLEVRRGMERRTVPGAVVGGIVGAGTGALIAVAGISCDRGGIGLNCSSFEAHLVGGGAGIGLLIGGLIGYNSGPRWEVLPVTARVGMMRAEGHPSPGIALSLALPRR